MTTLAPKYTTENELVTFDFRPVLVSGETISSASVTSIVFDGTDATPSALLSGVAVISNGVVSQRVFGGLDRVTYRLICTSTTSSNNTYTLIADLPVYSPTSLATQ